ncbi:hypothetical protein EON65_48655 [archaeon]|nr:MAG: hypothetical protein EON65_48655 [archaeon]
MDRKNWRAVIYPLFTLSDELNIRACFVGISESGGSLISTVLPFTVSKELDQPLVRYRRLYRQTYIDFHLPQPLAPRLCKITNPKAWREIWCVFKQTHPCFQSLQCLPTYQKL